MNKRQLRATFRKYLFSYTFEALQPVPVKQEPEPGELLNHLKPTK